MRLLLSVCCLLTFGTIPFAARQTGSAPVSEAQAREWASFAVTKANGDPAVFSSTFKNLVKIVAPSYRADPFSLGATMFRSDDLSMSIIGPVSSFDVLVSEAVRKLQPTEKIAWPCGVQVTVSVSRIGAPDIERIVVKRDGMIVPPISSQLVAEAVTTAGGQTRVLHQGAVCFAPSAFLPGAEVVVVAIPVVGDNIVKTLSVETLKIVV